MNRLHSALWMAAVTCFATLPAIAQPPRAKPTTSKPAAAQAANSDQAENAIRAGSVAFEKAFNAGDAKSLAAMWTEDGDYIDEEGQATRGRAAIEKQYAAFFQNNPGTTIRIVIDSIRRINSNTMIEDGVAALDSISAVQVSQSRYTVVHTLVGSKWLMSSVRDIAMAASGNSARLADLEWLLGTWHAEHQGIELETTFRWMSNKSFIQRTFRVTKGGRELLSGMQIIGWDPVEQRVSSWLFDSNGSYAVGRWSPHDRGWVVESIGVASDGQWTHATNVFSRVHDALVWKSINRSTPSSDLLDSDEIVLKRKA